MGYFVLDRIKKLCQPLEVVPTEIQPKLNSLKNIKAVLFDVYGTLLISGYDELGGFSAMDRVEAFELAFFDAGFCGDLAKASKLTNQQFFDKLENHKYLCKICGIWHPDPDVETVFTEIIESLQNDGVLSGVADESKIRDFIVGFECRINPTWSMPNAADVLAKLKESGKVLGVVSDAQFYTPILMESLISENLFDQVFDSECCIWSNIVGEKNPSQKLFNRVLGALMVKHGIRASEVLYVGNDLFNDVGTAKIMGCKAALFAGDSRSVRLRENDERLEGIVADAVITDLNQLLEILD